MSSGSTPNQGPMYWMPVVAVPYATNMGQVNMAWNPSQDPYGKDLPLSGVEYYRISTGTQAMSYPPGVMYSPQGAAEMSQPFAVMMDNRNYANMASVVCTDTHAIGTSTYDGKTCIAQAEDSVDSLKVVSKNVTCVQYDNCADKLHSGSISQQKQSLNLNISQSNPEISNSKSDKKMESSCDKAANEKVDKEQTKVIETVSDSDKDNKADDNEDDDNVSEGMDARSDGDSGCPSECADLSPVGGPGLSEMSQLEGGDSLSEHTSTLDNPKPRGKRRYYMYGNHKLVKPIKEIPLRFQILLAETSAAKARCEGQPIYMQQQAQPQQQPVYDYVYYQNDDGMQTQLNVNATCFMPGQDGCSDPNVGTSYMPECYPVSPMSGYSNTVPSNITSHPGNSASLQPAPLFVPPLAPPSCMPAQTTTSQNCQTIIVYSSHSTSSSATQSPSLPNQQIRAVSMLPPPFPPPSALAPPPSEHVSTNSTPCLSPTVSQVPRSLPTSHNITSVVYTDHPVKTQNMHSQTVLPNKQPLVLSIPPPNHSSSIQSMHQNSSSSHINPNSVVPPPPNPSRLPNYNNPAYLPVTQSLAPPPNLHPIQINGSAIQTPPSHQQSPINSSPIVGVPCTGVSSNQLMYIYPSPPTGQSGTPTHVVYMVSPAYPPTQTYQQQGVFAPPSCPVPVQ